MADQAMKCIKCEENFDLDSHLPKLLSCGHSICLFCSQQQLQSLIRLNCCQNFNSEDFTNKQQMPTNKFIEKMLKIQNIKKLQNKEINLKQHSHQQNIQTYPHRILDIQKGISNLSKNLEFERKKIQDNLESRIEELEKRL